MFATFLCAQVYDIFRRGGQNATTTQENNKDHDENTPPPLSHAELRAGLASLGVPLNDEDFTTLLANTDLDHKGQVSYPDFCQTLKLHRLYNERRKSTQTSPAVLTSQCIGQGAVVREDKASSGDGGGGGGGSARRKAMELAPADNLNLDGGLFHCNPATVGCTNPNYTTTMIPAWTEQRGRVDPAYRPKRRQSPAPAPGLRYTGYRPGYQGQTVLLSDNHPRLWSSTGEEAELNFRHILGVKARYRAAKVREP